MTAFKDELGRVEKVKKALEEIVVVSEGEKANAKTKIRINAIQSIDYMHTM